ncbi:DUF397 domain-containing protein [Actinomadura sp. 3N508]|uniref:DUF397 domain-containing protein n=1 Tax=Actinomadura sp. 3N508 TaxID=3375153 RepID=UPI00379AEB26
MGHHQQRGHVGGGIEGSDPRSDGGLVNLAMNAAWRKSSHSGQEGTTCVELADLKTAVGVRDSTDPSGPVLQFGRNAVASLVRRVKAGELDR